MDNRDYRKRRRRRQELSPTKEQRDFENEGVSAEQDRRDRRGLIELVFSGVVALFTIVAAAVGYWQLEGIEFAREALEETRKANELASKELGIANRPWLVLEEDRLLPYDAPHSGDRGQVKMIELIPDRKLRAEFVFKNTGPTPASAVIYITTAMLRYPELPKLTSIDFRKEDGSTRVIGPGGSGAGFEDTREPLTAAHIEGLKAGNLHLFFFGAVKYSGPFVDDGETRFCRKIVIDREREIGLLSACGSFDQFR
jgi:hypothetical protein